MDDIVKLTLLGVMQNDDHSVRATVIDDKNQVETLVYDDIESVITDTHFISGRKPTAQTIAHIVAKENDKTSLLQDDLAGLPGIHFSADKAYMDDIPVPMPSGVLLSMLTAHKAQETDRLSALKAFWARLANNPDPLARRDLLRFLTSNEMIVTKNGFFIAYRNALPADGSNTDYKEKVLNIHGEYLNALCQDGVDPATAISGYIPDMTVLEAYNQMHELFGETWLTDQYSGTTKIRPGKAPVSLPRDQCDSDPNVSCSRGLHVASRDWLKTQGGYFGTVCMMVLVDPSKVVAVPYNYNLGKMRVCEYFPLAILSGESGDEIPKIDISVLSVDYDKGLSYEYSSTTLDAARIIPTAEVLTDQMWDDIQYGMRIINQRVHQ